jgi:hypothetical protein
MSLTVKRPSNKGVYISPAWSSLPVHLHFTASAQPKPLAHHSEKEYYSQKNDFENDLPGALGVHWQKNDNYGPATRRTLLQISTNSLFLHAPFSAQRKLMAE